MYKQINTPDYNKSNILNIVDHEGYICRLVNFNSSHDVLKISISKLDSGSIRLQLIFEVVDFFSGPTKWTGANFCTSSLEEYGKLVFDLNNNEEPFNQTPDSFDFLSNQSGRLYTVSLPVVGVKIMAKSLLLFEE